MGLQFSLSYKYKNTRFWNITLPKSFIIQLLHVHIHSMLFWFKGRGELAIVFQYLFQTMNKEEKSRKNNYRKTAKFRLNRLLQGFYYQYQPKKKLTNKHCQCYHPFHNILAHVQAWQYLRVKKALCKHYIHNSMKKSLKPMHLLSILELQAVPNN